MRDRQLSGDIFIVFGMVSRESNSVGLFLLPTNGFVLYRELPPLPHFLFLPYFATFPNNKSLPIYQFTLLGEQNTLWCALRKKRTQRPTPEGWSPRRLTWPIQNSKQWLLAKHAFHSSDVNSQTIKIKAQPIFPSRMTDPIISSTADIYITFHYV